MLPGIFDEYPDIAKRTNSQVIHICDLTKVFGEGVQLGMIYVVLVKLLQ